MRAGFPSCPPADRKLHDMTREQHQRSAIQSVFRGVARPFNSVWFGITLLSLIFVYSSVGSAGILYPVSLNIFGRWEQIVPRQWPWLEMTEFEWFHWWPFNLMIALLCVNLIVVTVRRIPLTIINLGVWMIHTGIIILAIGSVYYFSTKVEGDTPIIRRQVIVEVPGEEPVSMPAVPGNRLELTTSTGAHYHFTVVRTDPNWVLLSGRDQGQLAYNVAVRVEQDGEPPFVRQLLDGYPELTEDEIPGEGRAINVIGERVVDETLRLSLDVIPQRYYYHVHSAALYLREVGQQDWIQRPLNHLPRYNDYLGSYDEVWPAAGDPRSPLRPLNKRVEASDPADPLAGTPIVVRSYLRYAIPQTRRAPGGEQLYPIAQVTVAADDGRSINAELAAFEPARRTAAEGMLAMEWISDEREFDLVMAIEPSVLTIALPDTDIEIDHPITDLPENPRTAPFIHIGESGYAYRVLMFADDLVIDNNQTASMAAIEYRRSDESPSITRWVFSDPQLTRDLAINHETGDQRPIPPADDIEMSYQPGRRPAMLTLVAGPSDDRLRLLRPHVETGEPIVEDVQPGSEVEISRGLKFHLRQYWPRSSEQTRPAIVPLSQRDRDLDMRFRMVRIEVETARGLTSVWLPYHDYAFKDENHNLRRFPYQPRRITLANGREIELLFSRRRDPLPRPMILDDFILETHVGGFTGANTSVQDWQSHVRFAVDGGWSDMTEVRVNSPGAKDGYWYFQAAWDPPMQSRGGDDPPSSGLNYTVLGVGNRNGVYIQLFGCTVSVLGMCYAFYIKPMLKRRRQKSVYDALPSDGEFPAGPGLGSSPGVGPGSGPGAGLGTRMEASE